MKTNPAECLSSPTMGKSVESRASSNGSELSPIIVPSMIKRVSCGFSSMKENGIKRKGSEHSKQFLDAALGFLQGIPSKNTEKAESRKSLPHPRKGQFSPLSYKEFLRPSVPFSIQIDLSDCPCKLMPGALKDHINAEFAAENPYIDRSVTFSKIVNLRENLLALFLKNAFDLCTFALAWTYFLRLLQKKVVNKKNRKVMCAVCAILAYKFNEDTHVDSDKTKQFSNSLNCLDKYNHICKQAVHAEFEVYAHLEFSLFLDSKLYEESYLFALSKAK